MRIDEAPVYFSYVDPTTVRMVNHGWKMIKDTLKLRRNMKKTGSSAVSRVMPAAMPL